MQPLFLASDHHDFLARTLNDRSQPRGTKSRLAAALKCRSAHISQIMSGKNSLTVDMAFQVADFLGLGPLERKYLLLLVERDRASHFQLKEFFDGEMRQIRRLASRVSSRVSGEQLAVEDATTYYSRWWYAAIHILCALEPYQVPTAIAERIRLPLAQVNEALQFLSSKGIVEKRGLRFKTKAMRIHLPEHSPSIHSHHVNWRIRCAGGVSSDAVRPLQYTGLLALSRQDADKVREVLLSAIEKTEGILTATNEEEVFTLLVDFVGL